MIEPMGAAARALDQALKPYWPIRRAVWRLRWVGLRLRLELHSRAVGSRVRLHVEPSVRLGRRIGFHIQPGTETTLTFRSRARVDDQLMLVLSGGSLLMESRAHMRRGVRLVLGGDLRLGEDTLLSWATSVHCTERIELDDLSIVGEQSVITDSRHLRTAPGISVFDHVAAKPTFIGKNCWLGASVVVGMGVTIGDGAFIGGNSVVTKDVPAGWLAAGVPAKAIRELDVEVEGE